jgi:hypothetical protein
MIGPQRSPPSHESFEQVPQPRQGTHVPLQQSHVLPPSFLHLLRPFLPALHLWPAQEADSAAADDDSTGDA